jgi:hypothetical protein
MYTGKTAAFYSRKNEAAAKKARRQARLHPQSLDQKRHAQTLAKETLVSQRPEMAHRMRGTHQRRQTPARPQPQSIPRR